MIRLASKADVPVIARLGTLFFVEAGWSDVAEWDHDSIMRTLEHMVASDDGILLVAETDGKIIGMAGGLVFPLYFNHAHKSGQELFWWIAPEHRGGVGARMLDRLEQEARDRGAKSWAMIALAKVRPESVGKLYERRGYRASERSYIKAL